MCSVSSNSYLGASCRSSPSLRSSPWKVSHGPLLQRSSGVNQSVCFTFGGHHLLSNIQLPCDVSTVWLAGEEWWEWLWSIQDRFLAHSSLSTELPPAAVRHGLCHNCSIYQGKLRRVKPGLKLRRGFLGDLFSHRILCRWLYSWNSLVS